MENTDISLEELRNNIREAFNMDSVEARMAKEEEARRKAEAEAPVAPEPVDIYQRNADARFEESKRVRPNGSPAIVKAAVESIINGDGVPGAGLAAAFKKAKVNSDLLRSRGDITRADMIRQQYMDENFIPAVEVVVRYSSPDELLNSKEAIKALDDLVLSAGNGRGYTASYIKTAYGDLLGQNLTGYDRSDDTVIDGVRRIKTLSEMDNIRAAVGIAKQLKDKIDNGENIASPEDYDLIGRVVSFAY